ncbi:hypothetical protein FGO68_gene2982 [Halteria grandinella]|uniref:Uncharacterized protein n=1 Tax=Halteria grandinella TaxID=5974 RepID=A0A8J8NTN7_HALGN|nr:hypothetical protein FGO68_gene2982 [Halteria grandinella]
MNRKEYYFVIQANRNISQPKMNFIKDSVAQSWVQASIISQYENHLAKRPMQFIVIYISQHNYRIIRRNSIQFALYDRYVHISL